MHAGDAFVGPRPGVKGGRVNDTANAKLAGVKVGFRAGPDGTWTLPYRGVQIQSAYQPVYELATGTVVGHKAVLRCDDPDLDPGSLFTVADYYLEALDLSDTVRILHLCNYARLVPAESSCRLFVPAHPEILGNPAKAEILEACIRSLQLAPARVVLELDVEALEQTMAETLLVILEPFRALGCAFLANGYDGRALGPETLLARRPDVVAVEPSLLTSRSGRAADGRHLARLVETFRRARVQTLAKGIESDADLEAARRAGVELGHGFHLGPPETGAVRMRAYPAAGR